MQETMTIPEGLWLPTAVLLPLGAFFTYKASMDSALFEREAYAGFFIKLFRRKTSA
jgi:lipopolysaccharide export system permease protein